MSIGDYLDHPSKDQMIEIEKNSRTDKLYLRIKWPSVVYSPPEKNIYFFFSRHETDSWIRMLNNRLGQVRLSYIFMMHYFNKGIPDDEWYINPNRGELSIQYFPHFREETFHYKTMFDYYTDVFYYKFSSAWDTIFHIINAYYSFNIEPKHRFNDKVKNELKKRNSALFNEIGKTENSEAFKESKTLRNNITHNFSPNDISSGVKKEFVDGKIRRISMDIGEYTPSMIFIKNINDLINVMISFLAFLKETLESNPEES
ncbi:Cthe_2314 family HEPN domain-containing protein [Paenibacillus barengoltzii]|uniref:Cthe_2314 family HEPN domain-containing protein n=1 Tax=Paenibacillus barengoltzii TaxID=343517 RepID=UPI000FD85489|nr:Cthe_2314 family HEPN domain-containing protein [Paenibacillus barengoltzii]